MPPPWIVIGCLTGRGLGQSTGGGGRSGHKIQECSLTICYSETSKKNLHADNVCMRIMRRLMLLLPREQECGTALQIQGCLGNRKVSFPRRSSHWARSAKALLSRAPPYIGSCCQELSAPSLDRYTPPELRDPRRNLVQF